MTTAPKRPLFKPVRGVIAAGLIGGLAFSCGVALTATSGWLIVRASERPIILTLLAAIVAVRAFGIGRPVFRYAERLVSHNAALGDLTTRRVDAYRQLLPLTPARLGNRRRSDLLSGVVRDLDDEVDIQVRVLVPLITTVMACLIAVITTFAIHTDAGFVLTGSVIASGLVGWLDLVLERKGQAESLQARADVDQVAHLIAGHTTQIAAIGGSAQTLTWLQEAESRAERANTRAARGRALGVTLALVVTGVSTLLMAYALDGEVRAGHLSAPLAALLLLTPLALGDVIGLIPDAASALARSSAARDRLENLLTQTPATRDGRDDFPAMSAPPRIELRDVSASWTGETSNVGPLSLEVAPGQHIAITGPNGYGKSTLLAVIARHLDPTSGSYTLDGHNAVTAALEQVRSLFAVVDDDPHVFAGTLRANLSLADSHASDDDMARALRLAGLGEWLSTLPDGLGTRLGESLNGAENERSISGGERARLGVARALLSRRPVLLLDEPVAHLDTPTADAVIRDLLEASAGRTVIMVSHHNVAFDALDEVIDITSL